MGVHTLKTTQVLRATLDQAWDFFSNPKNLARITPKELDFTVLSELPERIYPGLMIEYRVRPLLGIPMRWLTEISHVEPGRYFVDEQRVGPYRMWHHEHHFRALGDGRIEMTDRVTYIVPFGPLGELVHPWLVKPQLDKIFTHRQHVVGELFR